MADLTAHTSALFKIHKATQNSTVFAFFSPFVFESEHTVAHHNSFHAEDSQKEMHTTKVLFEQHFDD